MTRINATINPVHLCDQHLLAEYRELPRIFTLAAEWSHKKENELPKKFTLGRGHVKFFYDKAYFLIVRYSHIVEELLKRRYNLDVDLIQSVGTSAANLHFLLCGDYEPTPEAHAILSERIKERLNGMKRITYYGTQITANEAFKLIPLLP